MTGYTVWDKNVSGQVVKIGINEVSLQAPYLYKNINNNYSFLLNSLCSIRIYVITLVLVWIKLHWYVLPL